MLKIFVKNKCLLLIFCAIFLCFGKASASGKVESVTVSVNDVTSAADEEILRRMAQSMRAVAQQIMLGKSVAAIEGAKDYYQQVLQDISDRVFAGYGTEQVVLLTGENTSVIINVAPWSAIVKDVRINVYLSGIDTSLQPLLEEDLIALRGKTAKLLLGVSVDSVDWAATLVKDCARDTIAEKLPDFKAAVDVAGGETSVVEITLIPVGSSVRDVRFELRSDTMPSLVLLDARKRLGERANRIRGLPVAFVARHKDRLEDLLQEAVEKERIAKNYKLEVNVDITAEPDADVTITLDSDKYRLWIEGYADFARDSGNLSGRLHAGRLISDKDEMFIEISLFTKNVSWKFDPGISRRWGNTKLSYLYRVPDGEGIARLEYDFGKQWRLRAEKYGHEDRPEFGLRYRIHEFLSVELVLGSDGENYLRLVGNL